MSESSMTVLLLPLAQIAPSADNPRKHIDPDRLRELADSIAAKGLIHPIVVRPDEDGAQYEIVVGERRYRAAELLGLTRIEAIVRNLDALSARKLRLIENAEREPVNALHEAQAYADLLEAGAYPSAEALAEDLGKTPRVVQARIQIARELCHEAQAHLLDGALSLSHAETLVRIKDADDQTAMTARAVGGQWSVRKLRAEIEKQVAGTSEQVSGNDDDHDGDGDEGDEGEVEDLGEIDDSPESQDASDPLPVDDEAKDQVRAENRAAKRAQHEAGEADDDAAALSIEEQRVERAQRVAVLKALAGQAGPFHLDDEKDLALWMLEACEAMGCIHEIDAALEAVGWGVLVDALDTDEEEPDPVRATIKAQEHPATLRQFIRCLAWARDCSDWHVQRGLDQYLTGAAARHGVDVDAARKSVL